MVTFCNFNNTFIEHVLFMQFCQLKGKIADCLISETKMFDFVLSKYASVKQSIIYGCTDHQQRVGSQSQQGVQRSGNLSSLPRP